MRKARDVINEWAAKPSMQRFPTFVGDAKVFIWPSMSRALTDYNLVAWMEETDTFICSCRGYQMSTLDKCRHIEELKGAIDEARAGRGEIPN